MKCAYATNSNCLLYDAKEIEENKMIASILYSILRVVYNVTEKLERIIVNSL